MYRIFARRQALHIVLHGACTTTAFPGDETQFKCDFRYFFFFVLIIQTLIQREMLKNHDQNRTKNNERFPTRRHYLIGFPAVRIHSKYK